MILEIDPTRPNPRHINIVADALRRGEIVVYPTDTCYGIGADILNKKAIERIYQIKGTPRNTPFSFVCADLSNISRYAHVTDWAYRILKRYLPGPYTFILEGSREVPKMMLTKRRTAGIRIPDHKICLAITAALGNPVISTSASTGAGPIWADPYEIRDAIGRHIAIVIDSGIIHPEPSSVISLINDEAKVLRVGKGDISGF
ncbi:MAG: L-threonylcarbamoyladenylate synthase [Dissulfurimicrobium sp.]|uniref:L-threonylcarbamoyladenylate synthase n=1 Tax=Dissulfurimicrobium TaxID=1769732 RepID=UPI001EDAF566|nr:L-threonylcarbamoyladenylate synthase [Dissulfurimicrobium hydrothermale]UKL14045.1 threonylcarbamoyl-AMP synthase [Dissulfurimicrobium hydrothermale]